jgi:hypothetical protein
MKQALNPARFSDGKPNADKRGRRGLGYSNISVTRDENSARANGYCLQEAEGPARTL